MTLEALYNNMVEVADNLENGQLVRVVVSQHGDDVIELQQYQLLQGKAANGEDMRPYYSEDLQPAGYFRSTESAKLYADWKQTLSYPRQAQRNADAPNLYINGKFHNDLVVNFGPQYASIDGATTYGQMIISKYGKDKFGLTAENWNEIMRNRGGYDELLNTIKKMIWR